VLGIGAAILGWHPHGNPFWALAIVLFGAAAFVGLALLLGGTLRAEAVLALANLIWLVFVAIGGVIVPLDQSPGALRVIGELTPPGAMSQALRAAMDGAAPSAMSLFVLFAWVVIGWAATVRWFRWL
jgi:ABC-2 type transport system permease protein